MCFWCSSGDQLRGGDIGQRRIRSALQCAPPFVFRNRLSEHGAATRCGSVVNVCADTQAVVGAAQRINAIEGRQAQSPYR